MESEQNYLKTKPPNNSKKNSNDPNVSKPSKSSYFFTMNEQPPIFKQKHSDKSMSDLAKFMGTEWNEMNEEPKMKCEHTSNYKYYQSELNEWKSPTQEQKINSERIISLLYGSDKNKDHKLNHKLQKESAGNSMTITTLSKEWTSQFVAKGDIEAFARLFRHA